MRLKSWERPRREGRNDKGRGGSARKRQMRKRLKRYLKEYRRKQKRLKEANKKQTEE
jgi:molybdenum-dependent DNA-binding transcriptional regulator ModE